MAIKQICDRCKSEVLDREKFTHFRANGEDTFDFDICEKCRDLLFIKFLDEDEGIEK